MFQPSQIKLIPDTNVISFYGSPDSATSQILTGRLVLTGRVCQDIKTLSVTFQMKQNCLSQCYLLNPDKVQYRATLLEDNLFTGNSKLSHMKKAQRSREWKFTIIIPGSIPESLFTDKMQIEYELVSEVHSNSIFKPSMTTNPIPVSVQRLPSIESIWSTSDEQPESVAASWRDDVDLALSTSAKVLYDGDMLDIKGVIRPTVKSVRVTNAGFKLCEKVEVKSSPTKASVKDIRDVVAQTRKVSTKNINNMQNGVHAFLPPPLTTITSKAEMNEICVGDGCTVSAGQEMIFSSSIRLPKLYTNINYDTHHGPITISHSVVFSISIKNNNGESVKISINCKVIVFPNVNNVIAPICLPNYEDTSNDFLIMDDKLPPLFSEIYADRPILASDLYSNCFPTFSLPPVYTISC